MSKNNLNFKEKVILVTGGAGFIGSSFVRTVRLNNSARIINLDKLTYAGNLANLKALENDDNHIFIKGDILDSKLIHEILLKHQPDAIVNFAAESHVDRSIEIPEEFIQTNVVGTFKLLYECKNYWNALKGSKKEGFRFLHISTDEIYGSLSDSDPAFTESDPYVPSSPYSASKASSNHLVNAYHKTYGFPTLVTNCSNNYGPYQYPEKLIPLTITNILNNKPLPVYGNGKNIRDWLYVEDHCKAIELVLEKGKVGHTYNIGGYCELSNNELVRKICTIMNDLIPSENNSSYESLITYVVDRPGHDKRYAINFEKIKKDLGWQPSETIDSGLMKTVKWYVENKEWIKKIKE